VHHDGIPKAQFTDKNGKKLEIMLKSNIKKEIDTTVTEENIINYSEQLYQRTDQELFDIS